MTPWVRKVLAEFLGTFTLVFLGCAAITTAGPAVGAGAIGTLGIALAFGLTVVAMAYAVGPVSGGHFNPAVSIGVLIAGRMTTADFLRYVVAQCVGAIVAIAVLYLILSGKTGGWQGGLGQTDFGGPDGFGAGAAFLFEAVATFLFVFTILQVAEPGMPMPIAGLIIGLTLTLIHLAGINISGSSVNPARSLGPALFVQGAPLADLWLYILAPLLGGAVAGALTRSALLRGNPSR